MKRWISIGLALGLMGMLLLRSQAAAGGAAAGLRVCAASVIPALFPFLVLSRLLTGLLSLRGRHRVPGLPSLPLFLLSLLGGYPAGAAASITAYEAGQLTRSEAERCLCICNNSGPGFFVGVLGSAVFRDPSVGLILYGIHAYAALCTALLTAVPTASVRVLRRARIDPPSPAALFLDSLTQGCETMLQICGTVVFFHALTALIPLPPFWVGCMELSSGILSLSPNTAGFISSAFLMGFGGLCVHLQTQALIRRTDLRPTHCLLCKLLHGGISALFAALYQFRIGLFPSLCFLFLLFSVIFLQIRKISCGNSPRHAL